MSTSFFDDDDVEDVGALRGVSAAADGDEFELPPPLAQRGQAQAGPSRPAARRAASPTRAHRRAPSAMDLDAYADADELVQDILDEEDGGRRKRDRASKDSETATERLMRRWMDERLAPELLRCDEDTVDQLMNDLEAFTEAANLLSGDSFAHTGKGKGRRSAMEQEEEHERILLVQMEIERVRYALRAYIRTRTYKIEKFAQYLLTTAGAKARMTDVEYGYAQRYQALLEKHFTQSVTQNLPDRLGRLDEPEMIVKPDLDQAVFACARKDCPPIRLPDGQMLEMARGEIHMLRYRSIRRLLRDGDVRLV